MFSKNFKLLLIMPIFLVTGCALIEIDSGQGPMKKTAYADNFTAEEVLVSGALNIRIKTVILRQPTSKRGSDAEVKADLGISISNVSDEDIEIEMDSFAVWDDIFLGNEGRIISFQMEPLVITPEAEGSFKIKGLDINYHASELYLRFNYKTKAAAGTKIVVMKRTLKMSK